MNTLVPKEYKGIKELVCPECGAPMILRNSQYGKFYGCTKFPVCRATHGAHKDTGEPLGIPGDAETKKLRMEAHELFDKLWITKLMKRQDAYRWLQNAMGMTKDEAHIARFDKQQCRTLIGMLKDMKFELNENRPEGKTDLQIAYEQAQQKAGR